MWMCAVAVTELDLGSIHHHVYLSQLKYFHRLLHLPSDRLAHAALVEHMSGGWKSSYMEYIYSIRAQFGLLNLPPTTDIMDLQFDHAIVRETNEMVETMSLPCVAPLSKLKRQTYVFDHVSSQTLASFRLGIAKIGRRIPIAPHGRRRLCPVCPYNTPNSEEHMVLECVSLAKLREETGVTRFANLCALRGVGENTLYLYVNGASPQGEKLDMEVMLERGRVLRKLQDEWLGLWVTNQ